MNQCPKCNSNEWDHANVGLIGAIVCTNCGEIYMMKDETKMKKKFKVIATMYTKLICEIEAENMDEAWEIAENTDGGDFTALPDGDWEIYDVMEITE